MYLFHLVSLLFIAVVDPYSPFKFIIILVYIYIYIYRERERERERDQCMAICLLHVNNCNCIATYLPLHGKTKEAAREIPYLATWLTLWYLYLSMKD